MPVKLKIWTLSLGLSFSIVTVGFSATLYAAQAPRCSKFLSKPTSAKKSSSPKTPSPKALSSEKQDSILPSLTYQPYLQNPLKAQRLNLEDKQAGLKNTEVQEPQMTLALLNKNYERYLEAFDRTSKINELFEKRNQLRNKLGTLSNRLEAKVESNLVKIKSAIRRGEAREIWTIIDKPFIQVEENYLLLANRRLRYQVLQKEVAQTQQNSSLSWLQRTRESLKQKKELKKLEMDIKAHLIQGLQHLEAYERYRSYLEYVKAYGINGQKAFAERVLSKSGIKNDIPSRKDTQKILEEVFKGQRPNIGVILSEFLSKDYKDGNERPFASWGLQWKIEKEIKALRAINFYQWFSVFNLTRLADAVAKKVREGTRTNPTNKNSSQLSFFDQLVNTYKNGVRGFGNFVAGLFEVISHDLQNIEAITEHLVDIISISQVHSIERVDQFERVLSIYGQQSSRKSGAFLLSFARSAEHRDLLKEISYRITLEETQQISKLNKYQELKSLADSVQISMSLAKSEIRNIREGRESTAKIEDFEKIIQQRITELEGIESQLAPLRIEIEKVRAELMNQYADSNQRRLMVGSRVHLLAKIMDAQEVARTKPALSFDLRWTNQVQSLVINTGLYSATAAFFWWAEAPAAFKDAAGSFLEAWGK